MEEEQRYSQTSEMQRLLGNNSRVRGVSQTFASLGIRRQPADPVEKTQRGQQESQIHFLRRKSAAACDTRSDRYA